MPTRGEIAAYPYQDGIEVWLAEEGGKGAGHSDFWRAERIGTFALFRGYQEDEPDFSRQHPQIQLDFSLVLWRVTEFLLYIERFAKNLAAGSVSANLQIRWTGLENRRLGYHKALFPVPQENICRQPFVESKLHVADTSMIRKMMIRDVKRITSPLFEAFGFFSVTDGQIKQLLIGLFDADKEANSNA